MQAGRTCLGMEAGEKANLLARARLQWVLALERADEDRRSRPLVVLRLGLGEKNANAGLERPCVDREAAVVVGLAPDVARELPGRLELAEALFACCRLL